MTNGILILLLYLNEPIIMMKVSKHKKETEKEIKSSIMFLK